MQVCSATKFLRDATLDHHREAERHVRVLDADATVATYARFLSRMFGFHAAIESAFANHEALARSGFDALARRKQPLLAADLRALGLDPDLLDRAPLPDLAPLSRALGAAYVIEGSTLGGAFIRARLALDVPMRFLDGYGASTGAMWKLFAAICDRELATDLARSEAASAARETFTALTMWLDEPAREAPYPNRALDRRVQA